MQPLRVVEVKGFSRIEPRFTNRLIAVQEDLFVFDVPRKLFNENVVERTSISRRKARSFPAGNWPFTSTNLTKVAGVFSSQIACFPAVKKPFPQ